MSVGKDFKEFLVGELKLIIDPEKCIVCGSCAAVCPTSATTFMIDSEKALIKHSENRCLFCGRCVDACQMDARVLNREFNPVYVGDLEPSQAIELTVVHCRRCGKVIASKKHVIHVGELIKENIDESIKDYVIRDYALYSQLCPECRRKELGLIPSKYLVITRGS